MFPVSEILGGNEKIAEEIVKVLYSTKFEVKLTQEQVSALSKAPKMDPKTVGIYVDPIDGTNQYVEGKVSSDHLGGGIHSSGIQICTVLIGAFNMITGEPFAGAVAQPFGVTGDDGRWTEVCYWGFALGDSRVHNLTRLEQEKPVVLLSNRENGSVRKNIQEKFTTRDVAGVGNKLLCVALGVAHAYYFSDKSTFKWDTCAVHAILRAMGGDIVDPLEFKPLLYNVPDDYQNSQGILACGSTASLVELEKMVANSKKRRISADQEEPAAGGDKTRHDEEHSKKAKTT